MYQNAFNGRTQPGLAGELTALPQIALAGFGGGAGDRKERARDGKGTEEGRLWAWGRGRRK